MELHIPTLAMIAVFVTVILGVLLMLAWRHDQSTPALLWWGAGYLVAGVSFSLLAARGAIPDVLSIELANTFLLVGFGCLFVGTRAFCRRNTPVIALLIAPLLWLTAMRIPVIADDINLRAVLVTSLQASFVLLMAYELWRERGEALLSRWPAIIVLVTHAMMLGLRAVAVNASNEIGTDFFRGPIFAGLTFGTVLYTITIAFLLLALTKEQTELRHKIAALIDPLTGLANRRAFMTEAEAAIAVRGSRSEPLVVLLADLDHFKKINDVFGHAVGDRALVIFARTLMHTIGRNDVVGRIGGEEFAIVLPHDDEPAALALAENIRRRFAEATADIDGHAVAATVSIGVASSRIGTPNLLGLMERADAALYQAKASGRNRVAASVAGADYDHALAAAALPPLTVVAAA
jgi:diguanylate cyclase (GGDEF)-like protein